MMETIFFVCLFLATPRRAASTYICFRIIYKLCLVWWTCAGRRMAMFHGCGCGQLAKRTFIRVAICQMPLEQQPQHTPNKWKGRE